jgi:hypothetical protein
MSGRGKGGTVSSTFPHLPPHSPLCYSHLLPRRFAVSRVLAKVELFAAVAVGFTVTAFKASHTAVGTVHVPPISCCPPPGITKPAIRRLTRRSGVKRISRPIHEDTRGVLKIFLDNIVRDTVAYTAHANRYATFPPPQRTSAHRFV